jgi:tetratricopeptide (TPR) repeat protein
MNHSARAEAGRAHLSLALDRTEDLKLRARCLQALGTLGLASMDPIPSLQAADAWRGLGDIDGEVMSLLYAANLHGLGGDGARTMEIVERASARLATAPPDEELSWMLDAVRADALSLLGRHREAEALIGPRLADTSPRTWKQFWVATKGADIALNAGRPADALALYAQALQNVQSISSPTGELMLEVMVTDTIAPALLQLGRVEEAATTLAICELVHTELSWPPVGLFATSLSEVRDRLDDQQRATAVRHAKALGVRRGLDWVGAVASGEEKAPASAGLR